MDEKERIEREALAYFLRLYNRTHDARYKMTVKREKPDFEIEDKQKKSHVAVEVSHIFHDKKEAMMFLGRDDSEIHGIITAEDHVKVLMRILKQKAVKIYGYDFDGPIILVIRDYSKIFNEQDLFDPKLGLKVPASKYHEIWYLSRSKPVKKWDLLVQLK